MGGMRRMRRMGRTICRRWRSEPIMRAARRSIMLAIAIVLLGGLLAPGQAQKDAPFGLKSRTPWKTPHVTGAPEPPPPYKIVRAFPNLTFVNPLHLTTAPGINR